MERGLEFLQNHPFLFAILGVLVVLFFILENRRSGHKISPQSLGVLIQRENALLVDLRDAKEFKAGHISGSRNIPYSQLKSHVEELRISDCPIVMICNLGQVAGTAVQMIANNKCYRLEGGISNWKAQGLPLVKAR